MSKYVWHVLSNRWNSAISEYALQAARACELAGFRSQFICLESKAAYSRAQSYGLSCVGLKHFKPSFQNYKQIYSLLRGQNPRAIITYAGAESFLFRLPGIRRSIIRFRGQNEDMDLRSLDNSTRISCYLAPSFSLAQRLKKITEREVVSIQLGVDPQKFYFDSLTYEKPLRPKLQIIGRLDPIKGHESAMCIFKEILQRWPAEYPRPILEIIGEAANLNASHLHEKASLFGLALDQDYTITQERIQNISERMSRASLAWISSLGSEVICRVGEEFLMSGTKLCVSGVGCLEDLLVDSRFGFSYRGLSVLDSASLITRELIGSWQEDVEDKKTRSEIAASFFSLENMAHALSELLVRS